MIQVDDESEIEHRDTVLSNVLRHSDDSLRMRLPSGWVAVPTESGLHFDEHDRDRILALCQQEGRESLSAVALEDLGRDMRAFDVPATAEGLEEFDRRLGHFNYALHPADGAWVIVCTTDDYFVAIAPPAVVESILGVTVADAYRSFAHYAAGNEVLESLLKVVRDLDESWSEPLR